MNFLFSPLSQLFALFLLFGLSQYSLAQSPIAKKQCHSERVKVQMLGTGGPELIDARASTSYLLWLDDKARVIIDAGPGSSLRFKQTQAKFEDIKVFLFSHFHVDHSADLIAYIKGGFFSDRQTDLNIYGPSGTKFVLSATQFVDHLISSNEGAYPYLAPFIDSEAHSAYKIKAKTLNWSYQDLSTIPVYQDKDFTISAVPVHHGPFPALAYRIETAGCTISFSGDMSGRLHTLTDFAAHSDILIAHNAISEDVVGVAQLLHMKPSYIGKVAGRAQVKHLILTHMMARSINRQDETQQLIKKNYSGKITFANDLDVFHP